MTVKLDFKKRKRATTKNEENLPNFTRTRLEHRIESLVKVAELKELLSPLHLVREDDNVFIEDSTALYGVRKIKGVRVSVNPEDRTQRIVIIY